MNKQLINILGAVCVIIGVFSPLYTVPIIGSISYAIQFQGEGYIMAGAAAVCLLCAFLKFYWFSIPTALLVIIDCTGTLSGIGSYLKQAAQSDNFLVRGLANTMSPSFGFALLFIGAAFLIVSFFMPKRKAVSGTTSAAPIVWEDPIARDQAFSEKLSKVIR
jgi:hypothetical protein